MSARPPHATGRRMAAAVACTILTALAGALAGAQSLLTRDEALALAYPGATLTAERVFLTAEQQRRAGEISGQPVASGLVARYTATEAKRVVGRAYIDTHTVRTKKETLLISLDAAGKVKRVDATAFLEPSEYQAPQPFMNQFNGRALTDDLQVQRAIRPVAGATLTVHAVTEAVRRVLAVDTVLK